MKQNTPDGREAYITPSIPRNKGNIRISGSRKRTCLVSDMTIPNFALPIEVKNPEDIGCMPFAKVMNMKISRYLSAKWKYRSLPLPNMLTICRGNI